MQKKQNTGNNGATSRPTISMEQWQRNLAVTSNSIDKREIDKLLLNYMVIEGYKQAAEKLIEESNLQQTVATGSSSSATGSSQMSGIPTSAELSRIEDRMQIRSLVQMGKIEDAVEMVNDFDPEILDTNPKLYFHLQQQRLIELIRRGNLEEALEFAQEELAGRGEENPEFLEDLEKTMTLLAFDLPNNLNDSSGKLDGSFESDCPYAGLLDHTQRQKVASELNAAILTSQSQDKDPKLPALLKLLVWSQKRLSQLVDFPQIKDWANVDLVLDAEASSKPSSGISGKSG